MQSIRAVLLVLSLALPAGAASAQSAQIAFGGLKQDTSAPVQVTSQKLQVNQADGSAVFTGDVVVGQGQMRLSAAEVRVEYAKSVDGQKNQIQALHASGGVTLVTSPADAAEAQQAVYTIGTGQVVMTGNVLLTQGPSVISGDKLVVNLKTGAGHMEGHVKTTLQSQPATKATKP